MLRTFGAARTPRRAPENRSPGMPPRWHPVNKSDEAAPMPYHNALPPTVSRGLIVTILLAAIWSPLWPW